MGSHNTPEAMPWSLSLKDCFPFSHLYIKQLRKTTSMRGRVFTSWTHKIKQPSRSGHTEWKGWCQGPEAHKAHGSEGFGFFYVFLLTGLALVGSYRPNVCLHSGAQRLHTSSTSCSLVSSKMPTHAYSVVVDRYNQEIPSKRTLHRNSNVHITYS